MSLDLRPLRYYLLATVFALTNSGCTANGKGSAPARPRIAVVTFNLDPITHDLCCRPDGSHYRIYGSRRVLVNAIEAQLRQKSYDVEWWDEVPPKGTYDIRIDVSVFGGVDGGVTTDGWVRVKWMINASLKIMSSDGSLLGLVDAEASAVGEKKTGTETANAYSLQEVAGRAQEKAMAEVLRRIDGSLSSGDVALKLEEIIASRTGPCRLELDVSFDDAHGQLPNKRLDAGESGYVLGRVVNSGSGTAFDARLVLTTDQRGVKLESPEVRLGEIAPGKAAEFRVPVKASLDLGDGLAQIRVEAREKRGYDAQPHDLSLSLASLSRPALAFSEVAFNDRSGLAQGDGDGKPSNGETLEAIFLVRNSGLGDAGAVRAVLETDTPGVEVLEAWANLGVIAPGQARQGRFVFRLLPTFSASRLDIHLKAFDGRGEEVAKAEVDRSWPVAVRLPEVSVDYRIFDGNSPGSSGNRDGVPNNGEVVEVELTPGNRGSVVARGLVLKLGPLGQGLQVEPGQVEIGDLLPGSLGVPSRLRLRISRTFREARIPLAISILQKDFPERLKEIVLPSQFQAPDLSLGVAANTKVQKDERRQIVLEVENRGTLDAKTVDFEVSTDWPGLDILSAKTELLGTVAPGAPPIPVQVDLYARPGAKVGTATMTVTLRQSDFSSLTRKIEVPIVERPPVQVAVEPTLPPTSSRAQAVATRPVIFFRNYTPGQVVTDENVLLILEIQDAKGVYWIDVQKDSRSVATEKILSEFSQDLGVVVTRYRAQVSLKAGRNLIQVAAINQDGVKSESTLSLTRAADEQEVWAAIIGVNRYEDEGIKSLSFADSDAEAFHRYLVNDLGVPESHIFQLVNEDATRQQIVRTLGDKLRTQAGPDDIVFIYFAGHGASEADRRSGDGASKYLLPYDADRSSYNSTALSMEELERQFDRVEAERVVIILDSCFSGAAGGRTIFDSAFSNRGPLSSDFLEQIAESGRGRVVLTASDVTEVARERGDLRQGVFTHFLLEGLKGSADKPPFGNSDGLISVDEAYAYTSRKVREATQNQQNPQKFGHVSGELLIGRAPESARKP